MFHSIMPATKPPKRKRLKMNLSHLKVVNIKKVSHTKNCEKNLSDYKIRKNTLSDPKIVKSLKEVKMKNRKVCLSEYNIHIELLFCNRYGKARKLL